MLENRTVYIDYDANDSPHTSAGKKSSEERLIVLTALGPLFHAALDLRATCAAVVQCGINLLGTSAGLLAIDAAFLHDSPLSNRLASKAIYPPAHAYRVVAATGLDGGPQVGEIFYSGQSIPGLVVRDGAALAVNNLEGDPRFYPWYAGGYPPPAALYAPLRNGRYIFGMLAIASEEPRTFAEGDLLLLTMFADHAAYALLNARMHEQTEQLAALKERARLAHKLHNALARPLDTILMQLQDLSEQYQRVTEEMLNAQKFSLREPVETGSFSGGKQKASIQRERERLHAELTPREWEILALLGQGLRNREIAERLVITPKTVSFHATSLYQKLGASGRLDAVRKALALGLLEP